MASPCGLLLGLIYIRMPLTQEWQLSNDALQVMLGKGRLPGAGFLLNNCLLAAVLASLTLPFSGLSLLTASL